MKFKIYGPFSLNADSCEKGYPPWIDQPKIEEFWVNVRSRHGELDQACGVYIFTVEGKQRKNNKKTSVPWYVGKAERQTFQKECFSHRNQLSYNKIVTVDYKEVDCISLYLLARHEDGNKFSEPAKKDGGEVYEGVRFVEQLFMQKALAANSQLLNIQDLKDARSTHIKNILNWKVQGKDSDSVSSLKDYLQIKGHESLMDNAGESKDFYSVFGPYEFPAYKSG